MQFLLCSLFPPIAVNELGSITEALLDWSAKRIQKYSEVAIKFLQKVTASSCCATVHRRNLGSSYYDNYLQYASSSKSKLLSEP
jgi:hypothetical protein